MRARRVLRGKWWFGLTALVAAGVLVAALPATAAAAKHPRNGHRAVSAADPPLAFGQWTFFDFGGVGSQDSEGPFTFAKPTPVLLRVTDGFCRGDRFRVWDNGFPIFVTTSVATDLSCDDVPSVGMPGPAWLDQTYSKGHFLLEPGKHHIVIQATRSPFGAGGAWLEAIPMPVGSGS
jgi:hypothetical protein